VGGTEEDRGMNTISSRTPEGRPNHCPICDTFINLEPSEPSGDAPCPNCGCLLWFHKASSDIRYYDREAIRPLRERLLEAIGDHLGINKDEVTDSTSFQRTEDPFSKELGADSLDMVELIMELEEDFHFELSDAQAKEIRTFGDLLDFLLQHPAPD
jgi:acyl carrier protein